MLRFNRVASLAIQARCVQKIASRAAGTSTARVTPESSHTVRSVLTTEQLETKYKNVLQGKQMNNIYEVIERIELSGDSLSGRVCDRASTFLADSRVNLGELSDRQLSQLFSVYGDKTDAISKSKRCELLDKVIASFVAKGVKLGPLAKTAIFTAKVDNGSLPSVTEELQQWESSGFTPSVDILQQFARVYALEGNSRRVLDIISHMKGSGMTVDENIVGALLYSLTLSGQLDQAEAVAKKFSGVMNEVALRSAIADGLIQMGNTDAAIHTLASIPVNAKIQMSDNNKYIVRLLCNMLEKGIADAFSKLSPYLYTTQDGATLAEKNNNGYVSCRARSARSNGNLSASLDMYSIVHVNYRNQIFEEKAATNFAEFVKTEKHDLSDILSLIAKLEKFSNIQYPKLFLLESSMGSPNWTDVFQYCKPSLPELLNAKPELKMELSKQLGHELTKADLPREQRTEVIADVATILFTKTETSDPSHAYKIIYALAGHDVEYIISALNNISDERVRRETATAAVQQILNARDDPLRFEKMEKLLSSGIEAINISSVQNQVKNLLSGKGEDVDRQYELAVKIVRLEFAANFARYSEFPFGPKFVQNLFVDRDFPTDNLRKFVDLLENEPRTRLSRDNLAETRTKLTELGLTERIELLDRIKAQGQTYARWIASTVPVLEEELHTMRANDNTKKNAINKLLEVILQKLLDNKETDYIVTERILRNVVETKESSARLKRMASIVWEKAIVSSLKDAQVDIAEKFWDIKTTFTAETALSYISLLFVKNRIAEADAVCNELVLSTQTIFGGALESAGKIVSSYNPSRVDDLAKYLKEKLHLKENQSRRIIAQIRKKQMQELIANGELHRALDLAVEETKATGVAFGQYDLFKASFATKDAPLTQKVYKMVMGAHDKTIAILDLAFAMLQHAMHEHAINLLKTSELRISSKKLEFFINRSVDMDRPDMLKSLFVGLYANSAASIGDLNKLLLQLTKLNYKNNEFAELEALELQLKELSFPMEQHIKKIFDMQRQKSGKAVEM